MTQPGVVAGAAYGRLTAWARALCALLALACYVTACSNSERTSDARADSARSASTATAVAPTTTVTTADPPSPPASVDGVPRAITEVGTRAEDLYDFAGSQDWRRASNSMDSLELAARTLRPDERIQIQTTLDTLRVAISGHRRGRAIEMSNRMTLLGATLTEGYRSSMPADLVRLDYYGRELEIWSRKNDRLKLQRTAAELRRTWVEARPLVLAKGGAVAVAHTDSLIARLALAETTGDFARLATPFLDVVDELENSFPEH